MYYEHFNSTIFINIVITSNLDSIDVYLNSIYKKCFLNKNLNQI